MFSKSLILRTGVEVAVWEIKSISIDFSNNKVQIRASGWISQAAKDAGLEPAHDLSPEYDADGNQELAVAALAFSEGRIQLDPVFDQGA